MKAGLASHFLLAVAILWAGPAAAVSILTFDEVQPGMEGTGRTVFHGTEVETFQVEILAKLPDVGPDQNLILGRLSGGPLAETGVLAGMSGSPVFVGDRLVGAVSYSWGFSTEPLAGITPIEEMLEIAELEGARSTRTARLAPSAFEPDRFHSSERLAAHFAEQWRILASSRGVGPPSIPLAIAGLGTIGLARISSRLADAGFLPLQSAIPAGDASALPSEPLGPGSAMGLKLVSGDVDMTATGTVTWVEDDRLLGFGHPLFGLGALDLPLTGARVEALLPSLHQSSRIATPLAEVGALRQDRASGVLARLGAKPRTIPIRLQLTSASVGERTFRFDVADDPLLSPLLLYSSLSGILAAKERRVGGASLRLREGSVIKMIGSEDVELDNLFAGPAAFDLGSGLPAYVLYLIMNNAWTQPQIAGINLLLDYEELPRTARIRRVTLDRYRAAPGDAVEVTVVLSPYRGRDLVIKREIEIPRATSARELTVLAGGAFAVSRVEAREDPVLPHDFDELVRLINRLRRNDRLYILLVQEDAGLRAGGARLPNLPPSVATLLTEPRRSGSAPGEAERGLLEQTVQAEYAVEGSARITLAVERP